jgi:chromosome segregation ATPase
MNNSSSKKLSTKSSKRNSPKSQARNKSSASFGLKEDNSIDTELLKTNLQEFYKNSKDKLLKLKNEINVIEAENDKQKEENARLSMRYSELQTNNEELNLRLKGMKERLVAGQKHKSNMQNQIRETRKEMESMSRRMDTIKIDTNYRVKMIQNDIDHTNVVKENNVKSIKKKIENEENLRDNLNSKINDIKSEIDKYKTLINEIYESDNQRSKQLQKDTAEMTKFLSEL